MAGQFGRKMQTAQPEVVAGVPSRSYWDQRRAWDREVKEAYENPGGTLGASGVTPGSYTSTNLTVNAQGLITAASNGTSGGIGAGSIGVSHATVAANFNISTEGTIDWFAAGAVNPFRPSGAVDNGLHAKLSGGYIASDYEWCRAGGSTFTPFTSASGFILSTTAADELNGAVVSSANWTGFFPAAGTPTGWGIRWRVPASSTASRTCKLYWGHFSSTMTLTATLSDASAAANVSTHDIGAAAGTGLLATSFAFQAGSPGAWMTVTVLCTTNKGSSPNVTLLGISLF